jgi:hypothetical protein
MVVQVGRRPKGVAENCVEVGREEVVSREWGLRSGGWNNDQRSANIVDGCNHSSWLTPWSTDLENIVVHSASQEILRLSWNPKVYYRVHNNPPPAPILRWMNPIHIPKSYFSKIFFLFFSYLRQGLLSGDLITLIIFGEEHKSWHNHSTEQHNKAGLTCQWFAWFPYADSTSLAVSSSSCQATCYWRIAKGEGSITYHYYLICLNMIIFKL